MEMTNEDNLQVQLKLNRINDQIADYKTFIEEQNKKIEELEMQLKLQREGLVQKKEISMDGTLFYFVWDDTSKQAHNRSKFNSRTGNDKYKDITETDHTDIVERIKETGEVKLDSVSLMKYTYLKPKYSALIDDLLPHDIDSKVSYLPPFPVWLHVTIRAIFDSKMNEVLFSYNKGKNITRFPEYVFSWLGTFHVDKDTRSIKMLEYTERDSIARKNRCDLLLGLEAASAAKLWEISIFKEFLEEELGLDELVYFLHCRFILFIGPQLDVPTAGFCVTHFVAKDRVNLRIDRIMYAYSEEERKDLKIKLDQYNRVTYKDVNAYDYGMVLRILLEFYRREKKENFARFEHLYNTAISTLKSQKTDISFSNFYKIMSGDYDKNITDVDASNIYRESYIAGGCNVNCESLLLTFCETPFWIKYLRLKGQNLEPKYDSRGDINQDDNKGKECAAVYR